MKSQSVFPPLCLLGDTAVIADEMDLTTFYSRLFPRLAALTAGTLCRVVGYEKILPDGRAERFLGVEIPPETALPEGWQRWICTDDRHRIEHDGTAIAVPLQWDWRAISPQGQTVGEFRDDTGTYRMTANSWLVPPEEGTSERDAVLLTPYDPDWPQRYERMAAELRAHFGPAVLRLEHYGSTAVPGLPAKPVIDILMEVASFESAGPLLLPALTRPEWEFWWYNDHLTFVRRDVPGGVRICHLHVAPAGHRLWDGLAFRDYLRAHPETAREYAALKQSLAACHKTDREAYTNAKTAFVRTVTDRALAGER